MQIDPRTWQRIFARMSPDGFTLAMSRFGRPESGVTYTVGLSNIGLPELATYGHDFEQSCLLVNHVAHSLLKGQIPCALYAPFVVPGHCHQMELQEVPSETYGSMLPLAQELAFQLKTELRIWKIAAISPMSKSARQTAGL